MNKKQATAFILVCLTFLIFNQHLKSQNFPYGVNYQAVVRDANGSAKTNTTVGVRLTVLKGSISGPTVYAETQNTVTNSMGQFNTVIGFGTPVVGTFSLIAWHTDIYFLKSEIQTAPSTYSTIGIQQLMAVPYALHARTIPPTAQRYTVGAGTYTTPPGVSYIKVTLVGGGGAGEAISSAGGNGGVTTFGTSFLTCNGGIGGGGGSQGGTATINSTIQGIAMTGNPGAVNVMGFSGPGLGGNGGASFLGGAGRGGNNNAGAAADPASGSGGGGCGNGASGFNGGRGGGAGGYIQIQINSPLSTYSYSVGTAGTGGSGSGAGGSGTIIVEEYY